jgi:hypothetical protein
MSPRGAAAVWQARIPLGELLVARGAAGGFRRVRGRLLPEGATTTERGSPVCSCGRQCPRFRAWKIFQRRTAGAREAQMPKQVACGSRWRSSALPRSRWMRPRDGSIRVREQTSGVCAEGRRDCVAVRLLSTQIVVNQAKALHFRSRELVIVLVNAFQQYGGPRGLATANLWRRH